MTFHEVDCCWVVHLTVTLRLEYRCLFLVVTVLNPVSFLGIKKSWVAVENINK